MLRLIVENTETSDATIPVRWCVDDDTFATMRGHEVLNPFILLSVFHTELKQETSRHLIPLERMMTYVQFHRAGSHRINGAIVWVPSYPLQEELRNFVETKTRGGGFYHRLYGPAYDFRPNGYIKISGVGCVSDCNDPEVKVADAFFAKEPSRFEKWWVNLWFRNDAVDQCDFRRRRFIAYTIQPVLVLIWMAVAPFFRAFYAAMLLSIGMRNVRLLPILQPLSMNGADVRNNGEPTSSFWQIKNCFICTDKDGNGRHVSAALLFPLLILVEVWILFVIYMATKNSTNPSWIVFVCVSSFLATVNLLGLVSYIHYRLTGGENAQAREERQRAAEEKKRKRAAQAATERFEELRDVVCVGCEADSPPAPAIRALPKRRQTVALRYQHLKARVCRPFARS